METLVSRSIQRKIIRSFLDVLVLAQLRKGPMSGYDVITFIHNQFNYLISSGTVYSLLYSLERDGLAAGVWGRRKRLYQLTKKGEETLRVVTSANYEIQYTMSSLLKLITKQ